MTNKKVKKINKKSLNEVTPEFKRLLKKVIDKYGDAFRELAKR